MIYSSVRRLSVCVAIAIISTVANSASIATNEATSKPSPVRTLEAIYRLLGGRLVVGGSTFYRVSRVLLIDQSEGVATLHAEADPLFFGEYSGNPDGTDDNGRLYYNVGISPTSTCGIPGVSTSLDTSNFLVFHEGLFVTFGAAFKEILSGISVELWDRPINRVSPEILQRLDNCAKQVAKLADAMPFQKISIYAADRFITEVGRTTSTSWTYEEDLGEDVIGKMTHLVIEPKDGRALADFAVQARAVAVMRCDYEGPHLELDDWKQGLGPAMPLERAGNKYLIGSSIFASDLPPFPAYTGSELRSAIAKHLGNTGRASAEEAKPCAPFLRGYKFLVRYRSRTVQEIFLKFPGGC